MGYLFQTFVSNEVLPSAKMNQIEANIRDHIHGSEGVSAVTGIQTAEAVLNPNGGVAVTINASRADDDGLIRIFSATGSSFEIGRLKATNRFGFFDGATELAAWDLAGKKQRSGITLWDRIVNAESSAVVAANFHVGSNLIIIGSLGMVDTAIGDRIYVEAALNLTQGAANGRGLQRISNNGTAGLFTVHSNTAIEDHRYNPNGLKQESRLSGFFRTVSAGTILLKWESSQQGAVGSGTANESQIRAIIFPNA